MSQWTPSAEAVQPFGNQIGHQVPMQPGSAMGLVPGTTMKLSANPASSPRAPGAVQPVRLTPAARQQYEEYISNRLAISQPGPRGIAAPVGAMCPSGQPTIHTIITPGVCYFTMK
jgi:hypothetical protein